MQKNPRGFGDERRDQPRRDHGRDTERRSARGQGRDRDRQRARDDDSRPSRRDRRRDRDDNRAQRDRDGTKEPSDRLGKRTASTERKPTAEAKKENPAPKAKSDHNAKAATKTTVKAPPSAVRASKPYVPGPIRLAPAPKPAPVATNDPRMEALAAAVRKAGSVPAASRQEGNNMYAEMIDASTPETRASTTRNAAEAARKDAERLDGLADELFARGVELKNKGMFGAAHLQQIESSKCRDTADTRRGMAVAFDQVADEFAAERNEGVA